MTRQRLVTGPCLNIMDGMCVLTRCSDILLSLFDYLSILENDTKHMTSLSRLHFFRESLFKHTVNQHFVFSQWHGCCSPLLFFYYFSSSTRVLISRSAAAGDYEIVFWIYFLYCFLSLQHRLVLSRYYM